MRRIMHMHLRLVRSCAHDPVSVLTDTDALAGLFEAEILEKLDSVHVFGILFQGSLSPAGEPFWQWAGSFCASNYSGQSCQLQQPKRTGTTPTNLD